MDKMLEKISSYNLFNNLILGAIYAIFIKNIGNTSLTFSNIWSNLFVFYFIGVIISRIGSIIIEKVFLKIKLIKYASHTDYIIASKTDKTIETLLETNNMYRANIALILLMLITKLYKILLDNLCILNKFNDYVILCLLLLLFIYAFRKQTSYIFHRVRNALSKNEENKR